METKYSAVSKWVTIISGISVLFGLYLTTFYNYLLFHSIAEVFVIVVACGIFIVTWHSRRFLDNNYLLFIGVAYLFIAVLELIHTLGYSGMGIFKGYGANLPTQLWIAARYMESLSLLIAPLFLTHRIRLNVLFVVYASVTCLIFLSIFSWNIFPVCFVEGTGLTPFKKISEYIICLILLGAIVFLYQKRKEFEVGVYRFLLASIMLSIAAELSFTFYIHVYGLSNLIGHYFTIISFYLIYKAIIKTGLVKPYDLLFRNLKQSENKARYERDRAQRYLDIAGVIIVVLNADQTVALINAKGCEILGYDESEIIGNTWFDNFLPERERDRTKAVFFELIAERVEPVEFYENYILTKDNKERLIAWHNSVLRDDEGKIIATLGSGEDITERKQAEEALRKSEEKYRSMLESMKDAAYICSPELRIEYMNPRMISRIGRDATDELCHKAIYNSDDKCSWCVFDQVQHGEHVEYELADPKNNHYYSVTNSPIYHSGESISKLTIFRDITESKTIESQLRQARKMESIGTLSGGIAHDFNNILYMITGNAELALEDIPEWNPVHQNLQEIKVAGLRAAGIVKQLLNFSRKIDHDPKPIGAITVIKDALKFLRSTIPSTVEIRKYLPDADITILADPIQINQVLMNLCINASQEMEETGGIMEITVEKETLDEESANGYADLTSGEYLKISLSDTGPGIDPEIIDRIFDPYFTTKEVGKGSGMGLAVVHGIVNNHNGAIFVDSELGKGTTFTILFPVVAEKPVMEVKTPDEIPFGTETILFVDDEKSIVNMTEQMLDRLGYKVETKLSPVEALELFRSKPDEFDLVITDMTMPQMTGVELSKKLKAVRSDIPVIICTGHSSLIDEEKAKELGIAAYTMKPIVKQNIAKTIRKVLDKAKGSAQG